MSRNVTLVLFGLLCVAQLAAAGSGIARSELALRRGTPYRFETAPVDPLDLFRGRYVRLDFTAERSELELPAGARGHVYAVLGTDARGFAVVEQLRTSEPEGGDYLRVDASRDFRDGEARGTRLSFPFDRFFMEESKARAAERLYAERARGTRPAYARVRVHAGLAVLEDLIVDGKPIAELIDEARTAE